MGPDQLGGVMETIARGAAARANRPVQEEELKASVGQFSEQVRIDSEAYRHICWIMALLTQGILETCLACV